MPERRPILFIDDGGVMNDNRVRGPQWSALIGPWLAERYGGDAARWSAVNREALNVSWGGVVARFSEYETYGEFHRDYAVAWCREMFTRVERPAPGVEESLRIVDESNRFVHGQVKADIPGAVEAIRAFSDAGYAIHGASGTPEGELRCILERMGVRDCFGTLYGPDIVDVPKYGARYYRAIFAHAGVDPADAVVLESDAATCEWAREAGAGAVHVAEDSDAASLAEFARGWLERGPQPGLTARNK